MKCSSCSKTLATTFLNKIVGTYVKDKDGKKHPVCHECQKLLREKDKILEKI